MPARGQRAFDRDEKRFPAVSVADEPAVGRIKHVGIVGIGVFFENDVIVVSILVVPRATARHVADLSQAYTRADIAFRFQNILFQLRG